MFIDQKPGPRKQCTSRYTDPEHLKHGQAYITQWKDFQRHLETPVTRRLPVSEKVDVKDKKQRGKHRWYRALELQRTFLQTNTGRETIFSVPQG